MENIRIEYLIQYPNWQLECKFGNEKCDFCSDKVIDFALMIIVDLKV